MTAKDAIKSTIKMADNITQAYVNDLSDEDLFLRPGPGCNHIAWQLGHLIGSEHQMISGTGATMPELPAGFKENHSMEMTKSDDKSKFATKAEYLALMQKMHEATFAALDAASDADLAQPGPESMRNYAATVGDVFNMIGIHQLMHVGQFVGVRRKLDKPIAI